MRYFLELRYLGAAYCGWQRQPDQPSVQQTLERGLTTLLREKIEVTGHAKVRRAKLYYLRSRTGKAARLRAL